MYEFNVAQDCHGGLNNNNNNARMDWYTPLFPQLFPKLTDPLWFSIDKATDDDAELTQLEHEHTAWLNSIAQKNCDMMVIGKPTSEAQEEEEEDEEDDDNDDDETDTHDDDDDEEMEVEVPFPQ